MKPIFHSSMMKTAVLLSIALLPLAGQTAKIPRTKDGKPDFNGIWQALNTANWDLQAHSAQASLVVAFGAEGAEPGGLSVVEGGQIPYKPEALAKKQANYAKRLTDDPEIKCYMPGVPRATYMPFPFQIVQTPDTILMAYEFASASRIVYMKNAPQAPTDSWMGNNRGHWEGDTLVIDVSDLIDKSWFDRAGDYHSSDLKVSERYSMVDPNVINYEATITDPNVYTRPWKISMPLYRHLEKPAQLMEFKCVPFVEELMYGKYTKKSGQ
jgi:hypothetical protein